MLPGLHYLLLLDQVVPLQELALVLLLADKVDLQGLEVLLLLQLRVEAATAQGLVRVLHDVVFFKGWGAIVVGGRSSISEVPGAVASLAQLREALMTSEHRRVSVGWWSVVCMAEKALLVVGAAASSPPAVHALLHDLDVVVQRGGQRVQVDFGGAELPGPRLGLLWVARAFLTSANILLDLIPGLRGPRGRRRTRLLLCIPGAFLSLLLLNRDPNVGPPFFHLGLIINA